MVKTGNPTVSFITINWKKYDATLHCIRSIKSQVGSTSYEIIVIDNESDPSQVDQLKREVDKVIIRSDNTGFAQGNNLGAAQATGKYLAIVNNDAILDRHWLKEAMKRKQKQFLFGSEEVINGNGSVIRRYSVGRIHPLIGLATQSRNSAPEQTATFAAGSNIFIKKSLFEACHGFDEEYFAYYEDVDLSLRLAMLGSQPVYVPTMKILHAVSSSTANNPSWRYRQVLKNRYLLMARHSSLWPIRFVACIIHDILKGSLGYCLVSVVHLVRSSNEIVEKKIRYKAHIYSSWQALRRISYLRQQRKTFQEAGLYSAQTWRRVVHKYHQAHRYFNK